MHQHEHFHRHGNILADNWSEKLRLIGDINRARIVDALMGGLPLSAGELAFRCKLSAPATSSHLTKLQKAGYIMPEQLGRQRFYRLRNLGIARQLEQLLHLFPADTETNCPSSLRNGRFCYDHLAGRFGLLLLQQMIMNKWLKRTETDIVLLPKGKAKLAELDIPLEKLSKAKRKLTRTCMDWSERRPHLAGALGGALAQSFLERDWIIRDRNSRAIYIPKKASSSLARWLSLTPDQLTDYHQP